MTEKVGSCGHGRRLAIGCREQESRASSDGSGDRETAGQAAEGSTSCKARPQVGAVQVCVNDEAPSAGV